MAEEDDEIQLKGLEQLLKVLKGKPPQIKIGVLGASGRSGKGKESDNATIGAVHEYGAPNRGIPQRSFLRIPLMENLQKEMEASGLLDEKAMEEVIKQGTMKPWLEKVAIMAEAVVDDAFETKGNGKWPAWKTPGYTNEGGTLLVDSGQLRRSITSKIE